jgi:hypothetical protein
MHHYVDLKPRSYCQRRLDAKVAARDFLTDLIAVSSELSCSAITVLPLALEKRTLTIPVNH